MILSQQTQAAIIAARLKGEMPTIDPANLDDTWYEYYRAITDGITYADLLQEFGSLSEADLVAMRLVKQLLAQPIVYQPASVTIPNLPDLSWLWHRWMLQSNVIALYGDPAAGKSVVALEIARRIIQGSTYPDGTPVGDPGRVLYIDAENRPALLKIRVQPWTQDELSRLYYVGPDDRRFMINLDYDLDRERILDRMFHIRPRLVILDSYGASSIRAEKSKEDAQELLMLLTQIAHDYECSILAITHPRKPSPAMQLALPTMEDSIYEVRGTSYIVGTVLNLIKLRLVGVDRNGPRIMKLLKSNASTYPDPVGVTIQPWELDGEVPIVEFGDAPSFDDAVPQIEQCENWLIEYLQVNGPTQTATLIEDAMAEGYNERMVYRAKKRAGADIISESVSQRERAWRLRDYTDEPEQE